MTTRSNAIAENFFATLKKELVHRRSWPTRHELAGEAFDYIETVYNRTRRHSTLGMLSPADFENRTLSQPRSEPRRFAARTLNPTRSPIGPAKAQPCPAKRENSNSCRWSITTRGPLSVALSSTWTRRGFVRVGPDGAAQVDMPALPRRRAAPGVRLVQQR